MDAKVLDWRLLELTRAYGTRKEPLEPDDVFGLARIAEGAYDLHDVCKAILLGCPLSTAIDIFT